MEWPTPFLRSSGERGKRNVFNERIRMFVERALSQCLERAEGMAGSRFCDARRRLDSQSAATWQEIHGAIACFDQVASPLTQAFGTGLTSDWNNNGLDELEGFYRQRNSPCALEISPLVEISLLQELVLRAYRPIEQSNVLIQPLTQVASYESNHGSSLETSEARTEGIVRITKQEESQRWSKASLEGWQPPSEWEPFFRSFGDLVSQSEALIPVVWEVNSEFQATALLVLCGEVAILAGASTRPSFRRRGAQNRLLDARLEIARNAGCRYAMMAAIPGSASQRNAERWGFRVAYTRTKWERSLESMDC